MGRLGLYLILFCLHHVLSSADEVCEDGYTKAGGLCYKYFAQPMYFDDALQACVNAEANLISIHNSQANKFVAQVGKAANNFWIGLRLNERKMYEWADGTTYDYNNWQQGFPMPGEYFGNCVRMSVRSGGKWINGECRGYMLPFVCSKKVTSVEATTPVATVSPPDKCPSNHEYFDGGILMSPGFPVGYGTPVSCNYTLVCLVGESVTVTFTDLYLPGDASIELHYMNGGQTFILYTIDKHTTQRTFSTSLSNILVMIFKSGSSGKAGFWKAEWRKLSDESITCPPEYVGRNGNCYRYVRQPKKFRDAEKACAREGSTLVSIHSEEDNEFVALIAGPAPNLWIGLEFTDKKYAWQDRSVLDYVNWRGEYPKPIAYYGKCVMMMTGINATWQNYVCESDPYPFICEQPGVPVTEEPLSSTSTPPTCPRPQNYFSHGEIMSPGYPGVYDAGLACEYTLICEVGKNIDIQFSRLSLIGDDTIEIYRKGLDSDILLYTITEKTTQRRFVSKIGNQVIVKFKSASGGRSGGPWKFEWSGGKDSPTPGKPKTTETTTIIPTTTTTGRMSRWTTTT